MKGNENMTNEEKLTNAFLELDSEQLGNLKLHLANGTPVFCGYNSNSYFADLKGRF